MGADKDNNNNNNNNTNKLYANNNNNQIFCQGGSSDRNEGINNICQDGSDEPRTGVGDDEDNLAKDNMLGAGKDTNSDNNIAEDIWVQVAYVKSLLAPGVWRRIHQACGNSYKNKVKK